MHLIVRCLLYSTALFAMTSVVQEKRNLSGNSLSFMRSNFVYLRQHFPTKEICQERESVQSKSFVHTEHMRNGDNCHSLLLDRKKTQVPQKSRSYNSFMEELTEKNDNSKSMKDKEKSALSKQNSTHSDCNKTTAVGIRIDGSEGLKHPHVNGTANSECLLTNDKDIKRPLTNSIVMGVIRPIRETYTPKPLSNDAKNTTQHLKDTPRESWNEGYIEYGFETNSVQNDGDLAAIQVKNRRDLAETAEHRAKRKSNTKGTIYNSTEVDMATDSTASDTLATASFQPVKENESLGNFPSGNNTPRASYRAQETYVTFRNSSYQERVDSDKAIGSKRDQSRGVNKDVAKHGSTGAEVQNPRRVIRVISLKDKDFMSRARRNTICQVSRSQSSSATHDKTTRSTNGGDVPPSTPLTRSDKVQEVIPRPKFEEVNGRRSMIATFEEVSRKSENRVRVEVKVNLQPQNIATGVAGHELRSTEKEILTSEKVQGKDQLASGTVNSVLTENESPTSLEPMELEAKTNVVGQWKQLKPEKQLSLQTQMTVKAVTEIDKRNAKDNDNPVKGSTKVSRNNQIQLDDESYMMPISGAMNSDCFNEALLNKDHENVESFTQIYKVNNQYLDLAQLPNESFARKCESSGGNANLHEVNKDIKNFFADTGREKDNQNKCLLDVAKRVESTSQSTEKEYDSQDPQPLSTVKREVPFTEKHKVSRRVRRAVTISTLNEEITEALRQFSEVSADSWQRKDHLTQSENKLDATEQSCSKDGVQTASGDPNNRQDSSGSAKSDVLERNDSFEPRLFRRMPVRRPLTRSTTVITDDRGYLKQLSEEVRTMLILDARQRKLSADKILRRSKTYPEENKLKIDTDRESRLSNKTSEEVICPRILDSIDILKLETLPLEDRGFGNGLKKERNGETDKIRKEGLMEETSSGTSMKLAEVYRTKTSCDHEPPDVTDSVVMHEFTELISASTITGDLTYIGSELSNTGSFALNTSSDHLYESGDMMTDALKAMVILAASEQYMKQVEARATAEYEALLRRPRKDGKVFLPRRSLHQNSLPENDTISLTQTEQESEEN